LAEPHYKASTLQPATDDFCHLDRQSSEINPKHLKYKLLAFKTKPEAIHGVPMSF